MAPGKKGKHTAITDGAQQAAANDMPPGDGILKVSTYNDQQSNLSVFSLLINHYYSYISFQKRKKMYS